MNSKHPELKIASIAFVLLLPLFFVFHGFVEIYPFIPLPEAVKLWLEYLLKSSIVFFLFLFVFRSWPKAAVFSFLLLTFFFLFGSFHDVATGLTGQALGYRFLVPISALVFGILFWWLNRSNRSFRKPVRFINILLLVLIFIDLGSLAIGFGKNYRQVQPARIAGSIPDTCAKPDVYMIIADEYAGKKALQDIFGYDNTAFEQSLEERGFHVVANSRSNYNGTPFSVNSILNINYFPMDPPYNLLQKTREVIHSIAQSSVPAFFAANGYSIVNQSVFDIHDQPSESIQIFKETKTKYIRAQTFFHRIDNDLAYFLKTKLDLPLLLSNKLAIYDNYNNNRKLYQNTINASRDNRQPKFVYTHLIMPHFPYYFDEKGKPTNDKTLFSIHDREGYIGFLRYTNNYLLALIDTIRKNAATPPVIVLMSDHGFRSYEIKKMGTDYLFANFSAVLLPDKNYSGFYEGLSNVNFFRVLLNRQFHQQLPLLPDSSVMIQPYRNSRKATF